jgi:hypothetical protein
VSVVERSVVPGKLLQAAAATDHIAIPFQYRLRPG